jgi:hypothetical protein
MSRHPLIGCSLHGLRYDFYSQTATLLIAARECADMSRTIRYVTRRFSGVRRITTIAGSLPDTIYEREEKTWVARPAVPMCDRCGKGQS